MSLGAFLTPLMLFEWPRCYLPAGRLFEPAVNPLPDDEADGHDLRRDKYA